MPFRPYLSCLLLCLCVVLASPASATDVDGANDCQVQKIDFGDAPEGFDAYPAVTGRFPTCIVGGLPSTRDISAGCAPVSSVPGPSGYVRHEGNAPGFGFWLGCVAGATLGVDTEADGKTSAGAAVSFCNQTLGIDCVEAAFGLNFGQDECLGSNDAGVVGPITLNPCVANTISYKVFNCTTQQREIFLNILVDWTGDGDWNDVVACPGGSCAAEWAVRNQIVLIGGGCSPVLVSPAFLAGPRQGPAWLRITISEEPVTGDYPWAGSAGTPNQSLRGGETEDYPVTVGQGDPCPPYRDYGDAPERIPAYDNGVAGHFPTCTAITAPGTRELACPPISSVPGPTGYVRHSSVAGSALKFGLGCGDPAGPPVFAVDDELDGLVSLLPPAGQPSACNDQLPVDCEELMPWGQTFGQDECTGDADAGVSAVPAFSACQTSSVTFRAFNCSQNTITVVLNILVDWNKDGDWNDNFQCGAGGNCAYEWVVKNQAIILPPGCTSVTSPNFLAGPNGGDGWMRITLSESVAPDDFPWNGSVSVGPAGEFRAGETEDYPVTITAPPSCPQSYEDFGDAPEGIAPYPGAGLGHFPTCIAPSAPGTQEIECGTANSSPPGATGYVHHVGVPEFGMFWLGCGPAPHPPFGGIDSEFDGKVSAGGATLSVCHDNPVDCVEVAPWGMAFGQDECFGDIIDAGVVGPIAFPACSTSAVRFEATNCGTAPITVHLNVLVDWNQDGDWNDNIRCSSIGACSPEWAVKNATITLNPGCGSYITPKFQLGPKLGPGWMRISLTLDPVPPDFPWAGSAGLAGGEFRGGETEDYPVEIVYSLVDVGDGPTPSSTWFGAARPNPSSGTFVMRFGMPAQASVRVGVYDVAGRLVKTLLDGTRGAGEHAVAWDGRDEAGRAAPAGVYLIRLESEGVRLTQRAIRTR